MLRQWVCFREHERCIVKGSCMGFADFLQVRYGNQRIYDTTRKRRYYEWVAQNYEFYNNKTPSTTTVSDKYPYKTNHPTPILLDEWDTRCHIAYTWSTSNQNMPNVDSTQLSLEHSERNASNTIEKLPILGTTKESKKMSYGEAEMKKPDYEQPFVDVKTFEVKKYSFQSRQSFISTTKHDDDALPLGSVNGARFKAMIRKELKDKGITHDET
ncbi:hypothetical protein Tco_0452684 [Tanacetum coccineum]